MLSALKNFGVTFLVSALIFGVIAYFGTSFVTGTVDSIFTSDKEKSGMMVTDPESSDPAGSKIEYNDGTTSIRGDSFSFLIVTTDYLPGMYDDYVLSSDDLGWYSSVDPVSSIGVLSGGYRTPHVSSITLVMFSKETKSVAYSYITPGMRVASSCGYRSLSEIYYLYGTDKLREYVTSLTGVESDYCFVLPGDRIREFSTVAGTVTTMISSSIYSDGRYNTYSSSQQVDSYDSYGQRVTYQSENDMVLYSGELEMTADRLYSALSVVEHSKADLGTKQMTVTDITEKYIDSFASLSKALLGEMISNLTTNKNIVSTDFTVKDLDSAYDLLSCYDDFETVKLVYPCTYKSATDSSPEHFKADISKAVEMFDKYSSATQK